MTDEPLPEHSYVAITRDIETPDSTLLSGTIGTIVAVYPSSYLVEFDPLWEAVQQISASDLRPVSAEEITAFHADNERYRLAAEEFANATPDQRDQMIKMVRDAGKSIRGYWMAKTLDWPVIEYADMTPEQQRIVDAGDQIAEQFREGLTKEQLSAWIRERFLC